RRADEIKLIVEDPTSIEKWLEQLAPSFTGQVIWLHPEWSKREDPAVLDAISTAVKKCGHPLRAGYQMHRLYHVDRLDAGARPNIPLGGDVRMGY
ncbi:MAG: 7-carboxy-7-deazaguanine synthase QueE, partial [bacterium]|nr:7-carboxy-7-deazaguanine synthase QueE [bacterium]